jgi:hypothetical protein
LGPYFRIQKLSEEFIKEFKNEVDWDFISKYQKLSEEFIKEFKNEVGKTYESHCDHNLDNENSFGLSAWTKEKALGYHSRGRLLKVSIDSYHSRGRLLKVSIDIKDIGAMVHDNEKIRASKIEILEEIRK